METIAYTVSGTTTEISFTALGVGLNPRLTFGTHGPSKFTLPLPGIAPETATVIPFEAPCTIYTGRTGSGTSWSGGSKLFQGRRTDNSGDVSGARASSELVIEDAWYDLRFLTFQQAWSTIANGAFTGVNVLNPGTGYSAGDILTIIGGTGTAATIQVSTVSSGQITAAVLYSSGSYSVYPVSPVTVTGGHGTGATFELQILQIWPDAVLFQAANQGQFTSTSAGSYSFAAYSPAAAEQHITTGQAIQEILSWAIYCGVNIQVGTIDPALYVPFYPIRAMRCAEAIKIALRVHPDCACEIDYTTTPPTFNIRKRANLTAVALPYDGSTTVDSGAVKQTHITSQIKPRPELQPSRVGIYVKETAQVGGQAVVSIITDIWPTSAASGLRSFDTSLDMSGPRITLVSGQVTTYAAAAGSAFNATESTPYAWWSLKVPAFTQLETVPGSVSLVNTAINDGSKNCITVVDESDQPGNLFGHPGA